MLSLRYVVIQVVSQENAICSKNAVVRLLRAPVTGNTKSVGNTLSVTRTALGER